MINELNKGIDDLKGFCKVNGFNYRTVLSYKSKIKHGKKSFKRDKFDVICKKLNNVQMSRIRDFIVGSDGNNRIKDFIELCRTN